jgi:modulator of FtsH protease
MRNIQTAGFSRSIAVGNSVFKNTLLLLGSSFLCSAAAGYYAYITNARPFGILLFLIVAIGLPMLAQALRHSAWGVVALFAFTSFLGYYVGGIINIYLVNFPGGAQIVSTAMGATAFIFFTLAAYSLISKKDFSYLGGTIFVVSLVAFMAGLGAIFFKIPLLQVAVSGAFALISSGYIIFTLSNIIHGREDSAISATIMLFMSLFNLFISLLNILSFFSGGGRK